MSKNQEQMKELINDVRTGKTDKEVLCKEIQKDVNCLIYPVFGEDYKKLSPRAIIDICTNLDSCLLYTSPSPRDRQKSRMPSSA